MHQRIDPAELTPPILPEVKEAIGEQVARATGSGAAPGLAGDQAEATGHSVGGVRQVGQPGKTGLLNLRLERGVNGRTGLGSRFAKAPLSLSRPLYIDAARPHQAHLYVRMTGGGLAENDRVRQIIRLGSSAEATVTTQAATNVHRMNAGIATQWSTFAVGDQAVLEYVPGHTTLYGGSRLVQHTEFQLAPQATLLVVETIMLGRLARGERHQFELLSQTLRVEQEGRPLLSDITCVIGRGRGTSEMLFGAWPVWSTLVVVPPVGAGGSAAREKIGQLAAELVEVASDCASEAQWGVSTLVGDSGVLVRVAGMSTREVKKVVDVLYDTARRAVLGAAAVDLRIM